MKAAGENRRGLRQAPRGRGKRRPAQARRNHHAKESLDEARSDRKEILADAQGIKGTRVAAARLSRRRGGQATTHTRAWQIRSSGRPQSPAQRPERRTATCRSGPEYDEVPPITERPAVVGRNPAWTTSKDSEKEREDLTCRRAEWTGDQRGRQNSKPGTTCGRATNDDIER